MNAIIEKIAKELEQAKARNAQEVEELRVRLLGKKGEITKLFEDFRTV